MELWDANLIELDWIFILKKWIRILDSMFDSIWFDFCQRIVPEKFGRNP